MNIELHIEELILHGFAPEDGDLVREAVERELTRLFAEGGMPPSLAQVEQSEIPYLDGGTFEVAPRSQPEAIGAQVAGAIYGGITK